MVDKFARDLQPWPEDAASVFSQLQSDACWDVPQGTRHLRHHDVDAQPLNEAFLSEQIFLCCRSDAEDVQAAALDYVIAELSKRYWAQHEVTLLIKAIDWTVGEKTRWCEMLMRLLRKAPDFALVVNVLEFLSAAKTTVSTDILTVFSNHKRLVYPCFDILLNQDFSAKQRQVICAQMFLNLGGYRKLLCLRMMDKPVRLELARHILETPIGDIGQFGYPVSDNIDQYLEFLSYGRPVECLGDPELSDEILRNLIATYAEIAECLFGDDTLDSDELISAFPVFVSLLDRLELNPPDLHNLYRLHSEISVEVDETSAPHQAPREQCAKQIKALLMTQQHRARVQSALKDPGHPDHVDMIEVAEYAYGASAFDLFFALVQKEPERAFASTGWLYSLQDDQRRKLLSWTYDQFPLAQPDSPLRPSQHYSNHQVLVLNKILNHPSKILTEPGDRLTISRLGLRSDDTFLAMNAAWLLEDTPRRDWPPDTNSILSSLIEKMEPHWTTWNHKERKYLKAQERLRDLLDQADP